MKENFDNAGVAQKVATLLALPLAERALEMQLLKDDFAVWMEHNFDLKPHQVEHLYDFSPGFRKQLGTAISNYLMQGNVLQFQKENEQIKISFISILRKPKSKKNVIFVP